MIPPRTFPVIPLQTVEGGDHYCKCPICGHMVDELDVEEVFEHLEPDHQAPAKN